MNRRRLASYLTPKMLGLHLLAIVLVTVMTVMGLWQLGAYGERQELSAREPAHAAPVPLDDLLGPDQAFTAQAHARAVVVHGEYADRQLLVARGVDRPPWLVTALVTDTGSAILVVRGLLTGAHGLTDGRLGAQQSPQPPPPPGGEVRVVGSLQPSQGREVDADPGDQVVPSLSTAQLVAEFGPDLYSGYVVLTEQSPPSDLPLAEPPAAPATATAGLRNLMYALQWWVFAAFVVFMWWRMTRDEAGRA